MTRTWLHKAVPTSSGWAQKRNLTSDVAGTRLAHELHFTCVTVVITSKHAFSLQKKLPHYKGFKRDQERPELINARSVRVSSFCKPLWYTYRSVELLSLFSQVTVHADSMGWCVKPEKGKLQQTKTEFKCDVFFRICCRNFLESGSLFKDSSDLFRFASFSAKEWIYVWCWFVKIGASLSLLSAISNVQIIA